MPSWSKALDLQIGIQLAVMTSGVRGNLAAAKELTATANEPSREIRDLIRHELIDCDGVLCERSTPKDAKDSVVLFMHGGGYALCSSVFHRPLASAIAVASNSTVLNVNYRLAPEHPYPAALDDTVTAYNWLLSQGVKPENIVLAGDSAGGGLSLSLLQKLKLSNAILPAAAVLICPWVDLEMTSPSIRRNAHLDCLTPEMLHYWAGLYLQGQDPKDPMISAIHADLSHLPPLLIQTGGADVLVDEGCLLSQRASEQGVQVKYTMYEEMPHVWHFFGALAPKAHDAILEIADFIEEQVQPH